MANVTAKQLSEVIGVSIDKLLDQLNAAGVGVSSADDPISDEDKLKLLESLRNSHGKDSADGPKKITLRRKSKSELRVSGSSGRNTTTKTINVEVRKKRTYVRREDVEAEKARQQQEAEAEAEAQLREQQEQSEAEARQGEDSQGDHEENNDPLHRFDTGGAPFFPHREIPAGKQRSQNGKGHGSTVHGGRKGPSPGALERLTGGNEQRRCDEGRSG